MDEQVAPPLTVEDLYRRHADDVRREVARFATRGLDAHQIESETWDRVWKYWQRADREPVLDPPAWIKANARFAFLSELRKVYGRREQPLPAGSSVVFDPPAASSCNPHVTLVKQERAEFVASILPDLAETDRRVLVLRNERELSWDEVAEVLNDGRTGDAIRKQYSRELTRLRRQFRRPPGESQ